METGRTTHQLEPKALTLAGIAHRCARETALFFQRTSYDPRYCFEMFRRAIVERDQRGWELVYAQYHAQVASWVERHPAFPSCREETQYFVNRAFEKMWVAVTPDRFSRFPDLQSLLRYLQMCTHSVVLDQLRAAESAAVVVDVDMASVESRSGGPTVEDQVLSGMHGQELWDKIEARLNDEKERRVVYASFVLALKPSQIYAEFGDTFRDVREIYRVKENVLARLRRDIELKQLFGFDT
jgi:DNA-directed RNA polymerase specialized sigma24 family protein